MAGCPRFALDYAGHVTNSDGEITFTDTFSRRPYPGADVLLPLSSGAFRSAFAVLFKPLLGRVSPFPRRWTFFCQLLQRIVHSAAKHRTGQAFIILVVKAAEELFNAGTEEKHPGLLQTDITYALFLRVYMVSQSKHCLMGP